MERVAPLHLFNHNKKIFLFFLIINIYGKQKKR